MVNLDKLIEQKDHSLETVEEQTNELIAKNLASENLNNVNSEEPKMDHNTDDKVDDETFDDSEDIEYQQVQSDLQENCAKNEMLDNLNSSSNSELVIDENESVLPLEQPNKENDLINSIKQEDNFFCFLDLNLQSKNQLGYLFDQFRNLYIEQKLFDCTLVCEDQCIKAHKLMLAAVSSYFCSIFNSFKSSGCANTAVILQNIPARDMKLIIKMIYSINSLNPVKLNLNRAISLRKSVYILKIDYLNDRLNQCGIPQLNDELISSLNNDLCNVQTNSKKRKRSENDQSSSESEGENSECSSSMKHHKYKHRYLLSNEHLEQDENRFVKCYNDILSEQNETAEKMLIREEDPTFDEQMDEDAEEENIENNNLNSIKSDSLNESPEIRSNENQIKSSILTNNDNLNNISQLSKSHNQSNELDEKVIDFSLSKNSNNQEEMLKLMNSAISDADNTDKVSNLYKAMKSEIKKLWNNNDVKNNDNLIQLNNQLLTNKTQTNHLANDIFSQFCMAGANLNNLNPETARALLFTNELLKNNAINSNSISNSISNQLHHSINKNSTDNSLNTSTSSTNSSVYTQQQANSATAALVAAAQQQVLNASFLNKNSNSSNVKQQNNLNGALLNSSKSSSSFNLQNGSSSSPSNGAPVKRGRGRPPRHTQPTANGSDSGSINGDQLMVKQSSTTSQSIKQQFSSSSLGNMSNLNALSSSTANSIADTINAFNQQQKKWRPNLENLLALKIHKNKLNASSPTNDLTSSSSLHNSQANLLTNGSSLGKSSSSNNLNSHYSQNGSSSKSNSNNNSTNTNSSTTNSGSSTINNSSNQNVSNDGKNMCRYCPQIYYSNQAMNDHINNVHTKTAFKYICEFCSKEFSWKISLTKHLKHAHNELNTFGNRAINNLGVPNLNGLQNAINHLGANTITNQELLHSFMNRDNESAMLNFTAIGD